MTALEQKTPSLRGLFLLIAISGALLISLIGMGLYLWVSSLWPLVIAAGLAVMLLLVLTASYFVLNRRVQNDPVITVSRRYGITWSDRAEDEDWKEKQVRTIIYTSAFAAASIVGLFVLGRYVLPLILNADRTLTNTARIAVGILIALLLITAIVIAFRRYVEIPTGAGWRWTAIVISLIMILIGAWLFYGGAFPVDLEFLHARRATASLTPLIVLGFVAFLGVFAGLAAPGRRIETARDMTILGAVMFWLTGLFELIGPTAIPIAVAVPVLIIVALLIYLILRVFRVIVEALLALFRSLIQVVAALLRLLPRLGTKVWELIVSRTFWKRLDAWIDMREAQLRILNRYVPEWTEIFLMWANGTIPTWEEAGTKWTTAARDRGAKWLEARQTFQRRLKEISGQQETTVSS